MLREICARETIRHYTDFMRRRNTARREAGVMEHVIASQIDAILSVAEASIFANTVTHMSPFGRLGLDYRQLQHKHKPCTHLFVVE